MQNPFFSSQEELDNFDSTIPTLSKQIISDRATVSKYLNDFSNLIEKIQSGDPSDFNFIQAINCFHVVSSFLSSDSEKENSLIQLLSTQICSITGTTIDKMKQIFDDFCNQPLPLRKQPYPPLCGSKQILENEILPCGSFICFKKGNLYLLGLIADFDNSKYTIFDAVPINHKTWSYQVFPNMIKPISHSLPDRPGTDCEYEIGEKILALWNDSENWTSAFYQAIVLGQPKKPGQGYTIKYNGEKEMKNVPEKFIVQIF